MWFREKICSFCNSCISKTKTSTYFFILDSLSAQMNVSNTKFSRKTMKHLIHNASTLRSPQIDVVSWNVLCFKSLFSLPAYILLILSCRVCRDGTHRSFMISNNLWVLQECFNPQRTTESPICGVLAWHHLGLRSIHSPKVASWFQVLVVNQTYLEIDKSNKRYLKAII